jgi:homoserine O-acetyltransferase
MHAHEENHHHHRHSDQHSAAIAIADSQSRARVSPGTQTVRIQRRLALDLGGALPEIEVNWAEWGPSDRDARDCPVVFVMPSMSHSAKVTAADGSGWWQGVVGAGAHFGIDTTRFRVIAASPLGAPWGSTSPVTLSSRTGRRFRAHFPQLTPGDQARAHALLLDHLGIDRVHAVVGGSMGGMQARKVNVFEDQLFACHMSHSILSQKPDLYHFFALHPTFSSDS